MVYTGVSGSMESGWCKNRSQRCQGAVPNTSRSPGAGTSGKDLCTWTCRTQQGRRPSPRTVLWEFTLMAYFQRESVMCEFPVKTKKVKGFLPSPGHVLAPLSRSSVWLTDGLTARSCVHPMLGISVQVELDFEIIALTDHNSISCPCCG